MFREATNEATYYLRRWGIETVGVQATTLTVNGAGSIVVDANQAKILNDKRVKPYLIDEKNGLALLVPRAENVGQLRPVAIATTRASTD